MQQPHNTIQRMKSHLVSQKQSKCASIVELEASTTSQMLMQDFTAQLNQGEEHLAQKPGTAGKVVVGTTSPKERLTAGGTARSSSVRPQQATVAQPDLPVDEQSLEHQVVQRKSLLHSKYDKSPPSKTPWFQSEDQQDQEEHSSISDLIMKKLTIASQPDLTPFEQRQ